MKIDGLSLPDIPLSWLVAIFLIGLVIMRFLNFDSWVTASLSSVAAYMFGRHVEQSKAAAPTPQCSEKKP